MEALDVFLRETYHYSLQSLSLGDNMLFADFLSGAEGSSSMDSTIFDLLMQLFREETPDINSRRDYVGNDALQCSVEESAEKVQSFVQGKQFLLFDITCNHADEEGTGDTLEVDIKLPPLKVYVRDATISDRGAAATHIGGGGVVTKLKRFAGSFLLH